MQRQQAGLALELTLLALTQDSGLRVLPGRSEA